MSVQQQFQIPQGVDAQIVLSQYAQDGSTTINVTGWALAFTMTLPGGATVVSKSTGAGNITAASPLPYQATINFTAADTASLPPIYYTFEMRRTGTGVADELTVGTAFLTP